MADSLVLCAPGAFGELWCPGGLCRVRVAECRSGCSAVPVSCKARGFVVGVRLGGCARPCLREPGCLWVVPGWVDVFGRGPYGDHVLQCDRVGLERCPTARRGCHMIATPGQTHPPTRAVAQPGRRFSGWSAGQAHPPTRAFARRAGGCWVVGWQARPPTRACVRRACGCGGGRPTGACTHPGRGVAGLPVSGWLVGQSRPPTRACPWPSRRFVGWPGGKRIHPPRRVLAGLAVAGVAGGQAGHAWGGRLLCRRSSA
ncbi:hypothetical protein DFQ13_108181 [Actinokineospora spheciospongiae]|nr:hypothetical protein DFQ13_108181 [Actinokineospora spheciospongiae]